MMDGIFAPLNRDHANFIFAPKFLAALLIGNNTTVVVACFWVETKGGNSAAYEACQTLRNLLFPFFSFILLPRLYLHLLKEETVPFSVPLFRVPTFHLFRRPFFANLAFACIENGKGDKSVAF